MDGDRPDAQSDDQPDSESDPPAQLCPYMFGDVHLPNLSDERATSILVEPDRIEALTRDGRTIACIKNNGLGWACEDAVGLKAITVYVFAQQSTLEVSWNCNGVFSRYESPVHIRLDDLKPCVKPGTTVIEGDLLDLDRTQPKVTLKGPTQENPNPDITVWRGNPYRLSNPSADCLVRDNHYTCPAIGYRTSVMHTLEIGAQTHHVLLPVENCKVTPVRQDEQRSDAALDLDAGAEQ